MSDTNITKDPSLVHIGPCILALMRQDENRLVIIGKVDNVKLTKTIEHEFLEEVVSSRKVKVDGKAVSEDWMLGVKLPETLDPNTQYLVFKNCGTPVIHGDCGIGTITEERKMFYGAKEGNQIILTHNNGFWGIGGLPEPDDVDAMAEDLTPAIPGFAADELPNGDLHFTVVAVYDDGTTSDGVDSGTVTVVVNESVLINITPPTGAAPTGYKIYAWDDGAAGGTGPGTVPNSRATARLWAYTTVADVMFNDPVWDNYGNDFPGDGNATFTVTDFNGNEFTANTHYTIDSTCGMFCPVKYEEGVSAGNEEDYIQNGQTILITYNFLKNPYSEMSLGPGSRNPKYVYPVIIAMHDDNREIPVGEGVEIHLPKVMADSSTEWDLSTISWESGFEMEWPILFSRAHMKHGWVYSYNPRFSSYDLKEWAAMTDWNQAESCDAGVSS